MTTSIRALSHELLRQQGVTRIFGNPGSNELPFLSGLPDSIDYVLGLHEGVVVGMADGWAQVTGRTGLCNLHSAAGTGNAMGALTNAWYARTPLVLTAGQQVRSVIGMEGMLTNVEAATLPRPLVGFSAEPACSGDVPRTLAQAFHTARTQRCPAYVSIPYDDWDAAAGEGAELVLSRSVSQAQTPNAAQLASVVDALLGAKRPVLVLGGDLDVAGLNELAVRVAEGLDCPVWAAPSLFRLPFPNRHRLFRGVLPAGIEPIGRALTGHDVVAVLGAPVFRYHQHLPGTMLAAGTRLLQVTTDVGAATRAPMGEALVADPGAVLHSLAERLGPRTSSAEEGFGTPPPAATADGALHPEQVFAVLRRRLPPDTAYVVESTATNAAFWSQIDLRAPGSYFFPASGGLGFGLPAAVGAALGHRDLNSGRAVVGIIGDGSANYALPALWSAVRCAVDTDLIVLRNGTYGALRWFAGLLGVPDAPGLDVPGIDFCALARGYGMPAVAVREESALEDLLAGPRPEGPRLIQVDTALTEP